MTTRHTPGALAGCLAVVLLFGLSASTQAAPADWKLFSTAPASVTGSDTACFYDSAGVGRPEPRLRRVVTKCVAMEGMHDLSDAQGQAIAARVERQSRSSYVPPIAKVDARAAKGENRQNMILLEALANLGTAETKLASEIELNCTDKLVRLVSVSALANGKLETRDKITEWKPVTADTQPAALHQLLCTKK